MLDVLIGLAVVYSVLALACSALREMAETFFKTRALNLLRGIREMLGDPVGNGVTQELFQHPLISSLFQGEYQTRKWTGRGLPSYIPASSFSSALLDIVIRGNVNAPVRESTMTFDEIRNAVLSTTGLNDTVKRAVLAAFDTANGDLDKVKASLEQWFNGTMDRVSGWFKRRTQIWIFGIGLVVAIGLNVNSIVLVRHLASNNVSRDALVAMAPAVAKGGDEVTEEQVRKYVDDISKIGLPIGRDNTRPACSPRCTWWEEYVQPLPGWLITAFAISLGAPFWFDLLNRLMVIRSTVKPHEKSPEEGSEDRKSAAGPAATAGGTTSRWQGTAAPTASTGAPEFQPHHWVGPRPEEGVV
jgi:hypothetical protein